MAFRERGPRTTLALIAAGAAGLALAAPASAAAPARVRVPNAQPSLSRARASGHPAASSKIGIKVFLTGQHADELDAAVQAVSTPGSPSYGSYLTPGQFRATYAPSDATVAAVRSFLTGDGLSITSMPANRLYIEASGTVAQVQKAFGTTLANYALDGRTIRAASAAPTVPQSLAGQVSAVSGLSSTSVALKPTNAQKDRQGSAASAASTRKAAAGTSAPPPDAFVNAPPCSAYYGQKIATTTPPAFGSKQPYVPCGYTPTQLQSAYGVSSSATGGLTGKGVTVAIVDAYAAPTILSDANTYAVKHGQKPFAKGQFTQVTPAGGYNNGYDDTVNGDQCGEQGWYGEETLDVEAVHGMAPGAKVTYVAGASCFDDDLITAENTIVDGHLANIVSNSFGDVDESTSQLRNAWDRVFAQAAMEGIGYYFSSGDDGDGSADTADGSPTVESPANSPLVTAVGGTSLAVGASGQRQWETGWSTGKSTLTDGAWDPAPPGAYLYGAGGGTSRVYQQPFYQQGVVPGSLSTVYSRKPARVVPDVSAVGDPNTGFRVGETQTFPDGTVKYSEYRIGGTSLSSPLFAGVMALADQKAGHAHGFANPYLYKLYGSSAYYDPKALSPRGVVRVDYANTVDATDGLLTSLRSIGTTSGTILRTTRGYDDITGVGSPNGNAFLAALAK